MRNQLNISLVVGRIEGFPKSFGLLKGSLQRSDATHFALYCELFGKKNH